MLLELLNHAKICALIEPRNESNLAQLEIFHSMESTNSYLLEQAKFGAPSGTVCFAEQQTRGRGRLGRAWFSPFGVNIYCSLLWRFTNAPQDMPSLSIAVAVMVANVLRKYGISVGVQLKWPNDVLFAQRKLAGILLERNDATSVVIGIGLNLDVSSAAEKNWIDLLEITGQTPRRNVAAGLLLNELLEKLPVYAQSGLHTFLPEWRQYDVLCDQNVVVHTPKKKISGWARGINDQGELLLENEQGKINRFSYGEVSVRFHRP